MTAGPRYARAKRLDPAGRVERPSPATGPDPDADVERPGDELLAIAEVIALLGITSSTYYRWRRHRLAPPIIRLPGGQVRIRRSDLHQWLAALAEPHTGRRRSRR